MTMNFQIIPYKDYNQSLEILGYQIVARFGSKVEAEIGKSFLENLVNTSSSMSAYIERFKKLNKSGCNENFTVQEILEIFNAIKQGRMPKQ